MKDKSLVGILGTMLGATGTALQSNEILQTVSLIITIIGAVITWIVIPILNWWKESKKDGKITAEEIKEGVDVLQEGINHIKNEKEKNDENKR